MTPIKLRRLAKRFLQVLPYGSLLIDMLRRRRYLNNSPATTQFRADYTMPMRQVTLEIILPPGLNLPDEYAFFSCVAEGDVQREEDKVYYAPPTDCALMSVAHLDNLLLCMQRANIDFAVASSSLREPPEILAEDLRAATVFSDAAFDLMINGNLDAEIKLTGRVLRLLPARCDDKIGHVHLQSLLSGRKFEFAADGTGFTVGGGELPPHKGLSNHAGLPVGDDRLPVIFVLPIFLAVGGVERNTIEIVRHLSSKFHFVVITTERLSQAQGSLHHQMIEAGGLIYDLAEIASQDQHLSLLAELKTAYRPTLMWICNGSPWLADKAHDLRALFDDCAIVDQEVYDTEAGWIEYYGRPGVQSFDRFIAINQRIQHVFENRFQMDPKRIDLIYSAIDAPRFEPRQLSVEERQRRQHEFDLPEDQPVFAFIGRLSEQKRPEVFLEIVRRASTRSAADFFLLVGDGSLGPSCDAFIAKHGLENVARIPFCNDLTQLYPLLSGLLVTSKFEGLPIAMLEALAMGVPVFSTDVGDNRLVLEGHGNGEVFQGVDVGVEFFNACEDWRLNIVQHKIAAEAVAGDVRDRFSVTAIAQQYEECWRRAIAARAVNSPLEDRPSN